MSIAEYRPNFSTQDAARLARELYGVTVSAQALASERDQNFVCSAPGRQFVLKISSAAESREVLDFQNKALARQAEHNPSARFPRVCATLSGEHIATVNGADGQTHFVRMLTYLPGVFFADVNPHTPELLQSLGRFLGAMDRAFEGFAHPAMHRDLNWNMKNAPAVIRRYKDHIAAPERRAIVEGWLAHFEAEVMPILPRLRTSVIHNDGNDYNVLVADAEPGGAGPRVKQVVGIIDFGDMVHSYTVCEPAIGVAYAMLGKADPLAAAAHVVSGYHQVLPLTEPELQVLYTLACIRLCTSVALSAYQQKQEPDAPYLTISERAAWAALEKLADISPRLAHYVFRRACGLPPCPQGTAIVEWLKAHADEIGPLTRHDVRNEPALVFDLSAGSLELDNPAILSDAPAFTKMLFERMQTAGAPVGVGRYNEARWPCIGDAFRFEGNDGPEWRTIHLGMDIFVEAGAPVLAPLDGVVHSFSDNTGTLGGGPTVILRHKVDGGQLEFFTLYSHLSQDTLEGLYKGKPVQKGQPIGAVGDGTANGGRPPHVHFQVIADLVGQEGNFPSVAAPSQREVWLSLCPDPNLVLNIPAACFPVEEWSREQILDARERHISRALSISYKRPLNIVRGYMQYLYDEDGQAYLDAVNNVPHVGHCHPRVVRAAQRQMAVLNTNTRYLHENLVRYAQRLCATLPEPLRVCFFVCSGSEANDLALRLARTHTGRQDIIIVEGAYHGNLTSLIEISPYKSNGPGGSGAPPYVHQVIMPDVYRGPYKAGDPEAGARYARHIQDILKQEERRVAAFMCESLLGCGGQIVLPPNYLKQVYRYVREAGGVCIADEVQVGFGRVGSHFWGFELQGVAPDILTLGKPIGNGHPLAAVVTTPDIAASFNNGMEYFNTYGGNPVSCAVGLAVLDVIEEERLQQNALVVGAHLKAGLEGLMDRYPLIGNVRGAGLFIGVELVLDRETLEPSPAHAAYVIERMRENNILISTDGPLHNVLKIKPPLVFSQANADQLVSTLDRILAEDALTL